MSIMLTDPERSIRTAMRASAAAASGHAAPLMIAATMVVALGFIAIALMRTGFTTGDMFLIAAGHACYAISAVLQACLGAATYSLLHQRKHAIAAVFD